MLISGIGVKALYIFYYMIAMLRHAGMLESFDNTLLAYCPKRYAFGYIVVI